MTTVCITKYDAICNLGNNIDEIFSNAINSDVSRLQRDTDFIKEKSFYLGKVDCEFAPIEDKNFATRTNQFLYKLAQDMELDKFVEKYGKENVAIILATTNSGTEEFANNNNPKLSEIGNPALFLKNLLGTKNFATSISTACSSGIKVFSSAKRLIESGICKAAIVGGSDELSHVSIHGFNSLEILSNERTQPFSKNRKGINIGEGASLFTIEQSDKGIEIMGVGETSDAYHASSPDPEATQIKLALKLALDNSALKPENIDYINLHGTGTIANDACEAKAVYEIFKGKTPCNSTKSLTGHCLGAAATLETAICCKSLEKNLILKHNFDGQIDSNLPQINLPKENINKKIRYVINNAFGFGGTNAVLVLGKRDE